MVLAATSPAGKVELLQPPATAPVGERVTFAGFAGEPATQSTMSKRKVFETVAAHLLVDDKLQATYKGVPFMTTAGAVTVPSAAGGKIK